MEGHELIPKVPVNETTLGFMRKRDVGPNMLMIEELEAMGERHIGCGHDL